LPVLSDLLIENVSADIAILALAARRDLLAFSFCSGRLICDTPLLDAYCRG